MNNKMKDIGKRVGITLSIPVAVFIIMKVLCVLFGDASFATGTDLETICYTAIYTTMISLAMSYNIFSGRFDFSVGATISLAAILAGNIAKDYKMGPLGLLVTILLVGMLLGLISGLVYVLLGLPPMVTSLGVAMVFEAVGLMYNNAKGARLIGKTQLLVFSQQKYMWILLLIVALASILIFEYTRFGYNREALAAGQKIAVDIGIKEKRNAVGCYVAAGALLGIAGVIYLSKYGTVSPEAGLSSSAYFMGAFLPLFIGGTLGKYSNTTIGIIVGAFTSAMLSSGFVKLGMGTSMQTVMNGVCVMAFLIYTSNSYKLVIKKLQKAKLSKAIVADQK